MSYKRNDRSVQKRSRIIRWIVTGTILVFITAITIARLYLSEGKSLPSIDALCPFGGLETIFSLISGSGFVKHTVLTSLILLAGALVITLLFRRSFCGQICPLGTLQRIFGTLGGRLFHKRPEIPKSVDRVARYLKYGVLIFFIVWTWRAASLVMRLYDPWVAYAHITSAQLLTEFGIGFAVLVVTLIGSLIYERFFCKYLCPMGAFLGFFSKLSVFGIKRDADVCISCKRCDEICPMEISVSTATKVNMSECISCNECVNTCPAAGALEVKAPGGRRTSATFMTALVTIILAVIIGLGFASDALGWEIPWLTQSLSQNSEENDSLSYIKGSTSMKEIASASGIDKEQFIEKWGVSDADFEKPIKDIKDIYGFSVEDIKTWVASKLSLDITQYLESGDESSATETEKPIATENTSIDVSYIKGSTSMKDISEASGITKERFIAKWGVSDADFEKPIKDIKDIYGFSVDDLKTWVAEEAS
jgi:polyferredoxin